MNIRHISNIILFTTVILPLLEYGECGNIDSGNNRNVSCIKVPSFNEIDVYQPFCDNLRKNKASGGKILFVNDGSATSQYSDRLMRIVNEHCFMEMLIFGTRNVPKIEISLTESVDVTVFDSNLCGKSKSIYQIFEKLNSIIGDFLRVFKGEAFVLKVYGGGINKLDRNTSFGIDFPTNMEETLSICEVRGSECYEEETPMTWFLSITVRKFEPFTISDNKTDFNRGIDIILIESIAQKMNIHLKYEVNSFLLER